MAGRVSDWINHRIRREREKWISPHESVVGKWAYIKELATTNTRRGGIESIGQYVKGKCSER